MKDNDFAHKEAIDKLENSKKRELIHGCQMLVKEIPDPISETALDPRVYAELVKMSTKKSIFTDNGSFPIEAIRNQEKFANIDMTEHLVLEEERMIAGKSGAYRVIIYQRGMDKSNTLLQANQEQNQVPCMLYFHGGAFFAGSTKTVENFCKLMADLTGIVVISVDYHLAPEHPFPEGMLECYMALDWAEEHAQELHIDPDQMIVCGDSAGGTFAIDCCLLEREKVQNGVRTHSRIALQVLLYPAVLIDHHKMSGFEWNYSEYEVQKQDQWAFLSTYEIGVLMSEIPEIYMGKREKVTDPLAAPLHQQSLKGLPRTFMVLSEFDYLRLSGEAFVRKLQEEKIATNVILYKGMNHAFIDKLGIYPQAYDVALEVAKEISRLKQDKFSC